MCRLSLWISRSTRGILLTGLLCRESSCIRNRPVGWFPPGLVGIGFLLDGKRQIQSPVVLGDQPQLVLPGPVFALHILDRDRAGPGNIFHFAVVGPFQLHEDTTEGIVFVDPFGRKGQLPVFGGIDQLGFFQELYITGLAAPGDPLGVRFGLGVENRRIVGFGVSSCPDVPFCILAAACEPIRPWVGCDLALTPKIYMAGAYRSMPVDICGRIQHSCGWLRTPTEEKNRLADSCGRLWTVAENWGRGKLVN